MAQLLVRNLSDDVKERLRRRARERGHSMEEEARRIIEDAVGGSQAKEYGWASRLAAEFAKIGFTEEEAAQGELRGFSARPAEFE